MAAFSQCIYKIGINPVVDPPRDALEAVFERAGRSKSPIPVRGRINGAEFTQTLVKYSGIWRLYVNGEMLKASGLEVGDAADIEIEYDPRPRDVPMVDELKAALAADDRARAAFHLLTPSRRNDILRYLASLKTTAAVERNVEKVLMELLTL